MDFRGKVSQSRFDAKYAFFTDQGLYKSTVSHSLITNRLNEKNTQIQCDERLLKMSNFPPSSTAMRAAAIETGTFWKILA